MGEEEFEGFHRPPTFLDYKIVTVRNVRIVGPDEVPREVWSQFLEIGGYPEEEDPYEDDDLEFLLQRKDDEDKPRFPKDFDFDIRDIPPVVAAKLRARPDKKVRCKPYIYSFSEGKFTRTRNFSSDIKRLLTDNSLVEGYLNSLRALRSKDIPPQEVLPPEYWKRDGLGLIKLPMTSGLRMDVVPFSPASGKEGRKTPHMGGSYCNHVAKIGVYNQGFHKQNRRPTFWELFDLGVMEFTGRSYDAPFDHHLKGYKQHGLDYLQAEFPVLQRLGTSSDKLWDLELVRDIQRRGNITLYYKAASDMVSYFSIKRALVDAGAAEMQDFTGHSMVGKGPKAHVKFSLGYFDKRLQIVVDVYKPQDS